jgi:hypothetical protein
LAIHRPSPEQFQIMCHIAGPPINATFDCQKLASSG